MGEGWEDGWQKQDFNLHILLGFLLSTRQATSVPLTLRLPWAVGRNYDENFRNDGTTWNGEIITL